MANEKDLKALMLSRDRLWSPQELCDELGLHICELISLLWKAQRKGTSVQIENGVHTYQTSKLWLTEQGR